MKFTSESKFCKFCKRKVLDKTIRDPEDLTESADVYFLLSVLCRIYLFFG